MRQYRFELNAQRAEFYPGGCSVAYGPGCTVLEQEFTGSLSEALRALQDFAARAPAPSCSFLRVARGERTPAGFKQAQTRLYTVPNKE